MNFIWRMYNSFYLIWFTTNHSPRSSSKNSLKRITYWLSMKDSLLLQFIKDANHNQSMAVLMYPSMLHLHMLKKIWLTLMESLIILEEEIQHDMLFKNAWLQYSTENIVLHIPVDVEQQLRFFISLEVEIIL